jgi:DNA repair exonuclease SbcCD ATPase subunit
VRRNWFIAAIALGIVAIGVAAIAMRTSDDDGQPTAEEWASSICTSLSDWGQAIDSLADIGGQQLTADLLRDKLEQAEDATTQLAEELRDTGTPDLEAADQLRDELDSSTEQLESSFDELEESAQEVANAPAGEFIQRLAGLASDFAALQAAISGTVTTLENADVGEEAKAELQQAFADAPACQSVQDQS